MPFRLKRMDLKDSVIFALRQSRKDGKERVVGKEAGVWKIRLMDDRASDDLEESVIITAEGFKYPEDEAAFHRLKALGE